MTSETKGKFRVERWEENSFSEKENAHRLTKASVEKIYWGDIEGRGIVEYLFLFNTDGSAQVYGLERFEGRIEDKHGSFVMEHSGTFEKGIADLNWNIVEHSGTDDLKNIAGHVEFRSGNQEEYEFSLEHHLKKEHHLFKKLLEPTRKKTSDS